MNINNELACLIASVMAYCVGAFSSGSCIAWLKGVNDITKHGSGSSGATNVGRTLGFFYFVIVFLLDFLKAYLFLVLLRDGSFPRPYLMIAGAFLMVGNTFSCFPGWRGKGVATGLAVISFFSQTITLWVILVWGGAFVLTKTVGVSSVVGFGLLPLITLCISPHDFHLKTLSVVISLLGIWRHQDNVRRYLKKT